MKRSRKKSIACIINLIGKTLTFVEEDVPGEHTTKLFVLDVIEIKEDQIRFVMLDDDGRIRPYVWQDSGGEILKKIDDYISLYRIS